MRKVRTKRKRTARRRHALHDHLGGANLIERMTSKAAPVSKRLPLPTVLSLSKNFEQSVNFIADVRQIFASQRKRYIDFRPLTYIGPAAGLLLAAELDRRYRLANFRPRVIKLKEWNAEVKVALGQIGFFELLEAQGVNRVPKFQSPSTIFLKYLTGNQVLGEKARELRIMLDKICGGTGQSAKLFAALTEAMTNVLHHAYPKDATYDVEPLIGQWWMSASYVVQTKKLSVLFLDQGVGIPATLPRKYPWERIRAFFAQYGLQENHSSLIKAAMELGRTATGEPFRGLGLIRNIRSFVEVHGTGRLRILSLRGEYIFHADGREELCDRNCSLGGTLLDWEIDL
jgi:anti-sigma regulatory factor (Ser/Thr protein kinase)